MSEEEVAEGEGEAGEEQGGRRALEIRPRGIAGADSVRATSGPGDDYSGDLYHRYPIGLAGAILCPGTTAGGLFGVLGRSPGDW